MKFRLLRADEIDVRVAMVRENGVSLLLYKDARCDMNILDETVGAMNWQRSHSRDNANCTVSLWDAEKEQWISKEDTGTESNTEKEKGLASDSFKRACFNWGIGRELYTAPFIWITSDLCNITQYKGKYTCRDRFKVSEIEYRDSRISRLVITSGGKRVYQYQEGTVKDSAAKKEPKQVRMSEKSQMDRIMNVAEQGIITTKDITREIKDVYRKDSFARLTYEEAEKLTRKVEGAAL